MLSECAVDKNLIAAVLKAEAGGEGEIGQVAVLSVIWTRAQRSPHYNWPDDLESVVKQPYQFSCLNKDDPTYPKIQEWLKDPRQHLYQQISIVEAFLAGNSLNPVPGADHYLNPKTANQKTVKSFEQNFAFVEDVGRHRFYESVKNKNVGKIAFCYKNPIQINSINNIYHVKLIQQRLNEVLNQTLTVDGIPGQKTRTAWEAFKRATFQEYVDLVGSGSLSLLEKGRLVIQKKANELDPPTNLAERIVAVCEKRGYPLKTSSLNIIGLEGVNPDGTYNSDAPDQWNDLMVLLKFVSGQPKIVWQAQSTTEPGRYYVDRPLNPEGGARLDLGYHKDLWRRGKHKGYSAMVQTGVARLVRDKNRNHRRDDKITQESWRGINWHSAYGRYSGGSIGRWSAGCCVSIPVKKFNEAMALIDADLKNSVYDFILLWRDWLKEV